MRKSNLSNYTHSLWGTVPKNWKWYRINEICTISSGGTPSRKEKDNFKGNILWVTSGELKNRTIEDTLEKISDGAVEEFNLTLYDPETVIIAIYGLEAEGVRGTASILKKKSTISQACMAFANFQGLSNVYFYYWYLNYGSIIGKRYAQGTKQQNLSQDVVATIPICCPPLPEQQKIAAILSTQDKVIELKEKLLAQKQQQKKYLMQQLLTEKKRLPGFNEKWKVEKFSEIFDFLSTNTLSRDNLFEGVGAIQNIHYGDILTKFDEVIDLDCVCPPSIKESAIPNNCATVKSGDIIIADTAEDLTAGKAVEVQNIGDRVIYSGLHTMLCRPKEQLFSEGWLGFYINSEAYHKQLIPYIAGVKVMAISKSNIVKTYIAIPSKAEQAAIVEILSTADHEIDLLQKSIEAEKQKKKALMQLLLTGKVRVKI